MPVCKFTNKTLSHILSWILPSFSQNASRFTSPEESLKVCQCNFFQRKVVLFVIYLFNHDSSKSTTFILNMVFDVLLSAVFVKYSKLESFVSSNIKLFALCFLSYVLFYWKIVILHHGDKISFLTSVSNSHFQQ